MGKFAELAVQSIGFPRLPVELIPRRPRPTQAPTRTPRISEDLLCVSIAWDVIFPRLGLNIASMSLLAVQSKWGVHPAVAAAEENAASGRDV